MAEPAQDRHALTLGTAGHIDHGKTRLVAALTGVETDRLEQERRRGISIELGFAELTLAGGQRLGVVDVPGHERLLRTMVAGVTGIDLFLLVVAADDGVMPQTVEHLQVLRALGVDHGVVALSKSDLAGADVRALAAEEIGALLPSAPLVEVSARTGAGVGQLRAAIATEAARARAARERIEAAAWAPEDGLLHVDRSFTIAGAGTVITGTVTAGSFSAGARVRVIPSERVARIRSIEVHGRPAEVVGRGCRAALNLAGIARSDVGRGDAISAGEAIAGGYRLDVRLHGGLAGRPGLRRIQVHHGTRDAAARLVALGPGLAQLRLEAPLLARAGDRLLLRSIAPPAVLGGATVLDPDPRRHRGPTGAAHLQLLERGQPRELLLAALEQLPDGLADDPRAWRHEPRLAYALGRHPESAWRQAVTQLRADGAVQARGSRLFAAAQLPAPDAGPVLAPLPPELAAGAARVLAVLQRDGIEPRSVQALADELGLERRQAMALLQRMVAAGSLRRIAEDVYYESERLQRIELLATTLARRQGSISLAELRDALHTSRKYAQAIVEHLDREGLTVRDGDRHRIRDAS